MGRCTGIRRGALFTRRTSGRGEERGPGTQWNWSVTPLGSGTDSAPAAHLPLLEDVPEQWQVLWGEVPKRLDVPAMADGNQIQVIELCGDRQG